MSIIPAPPEAEIAALLAAETWFDAKDALEAGLATRMAEPVRIAASFNIGRFRNAPPDLVEMVKADIVGDDNDVAGGDASAAVPDPATKVPAGNVDQAAAHDDPATPQKDVAADQTLSHDSVPSTAAATNAAPDAAAIRTAVIAHARAVVDLCRLAGQPQMAGRLLEEDAGLDAVRARLLAAKAEAEPQITSHHPQPGPNPTTRPWGDVIARTFKLKG